VGEDEEDDGDRGERHPPRGRRRRRAVLRLDPLAARPRGADRPDEDGGGEQQRLGDQGPGVEEAEEAEQLTEPDQQGGARDGLDQAGGSAVPTGQQVAADAEGGEADREDEGRKQE
jgi:hypothetical protein